jgi:hypothetical protein
MHALCRPCTGVLPPLYRSSDWTLLYSTHNDGTSLHTLLRKAAHAAPSVLLVRDSSGALFGAYAAEPWRPATRFFGTGETFVFQVNGCVGVGGGFRGQPMKKAVFCGKRSIEVLFAHPGLL